MVTTLYLVRHGETEGSEVKRYKGSIDVPLSEKGIEQITKLAQHIANRLNGSNSLNSLNGLNGLNGSNGLNGLNGLNCLNGSNGLKAVYCSPLIRALKSAEIVAEPHGLKPIVIPELRERSFGIWEGMSFNEIKDKYPEEFEAWANNPLKYNPVEGESTLEVRDRVIRALGNILSNHNEERIAIVAHGGVNRIILCHIMGIPLENIFRIEQDFAAVNIIEFRHQYPVVKLLNGVFHG